MFITRAAERDIEAASAALVRINDQRTIQIKARVNDIPSYFFQPESCQ
jgi:hypothetical protein